MAVKKEDANKREAIKDVLVLQELLKERSKAIMYDKSILGLDDRQAQEVRRYLSVLRIQLESLKRINENESSNTQMANVMSIEDRERQEEYVVETKEDKERRKNRETKELDKSDILNANGMEILRMISFCETLLDKKENSVSLFDAENYLTYMTSIFQTENIKAISDAYYSTLPKSKLNAADMMRQLQGRVVVLKEAGQKEGSRAINSDAELFDYVKTSLTSVDRKIGGAAYTISRRIVAQTCGPDALFELDRINRFKNKNETEEDVRIFKDVDEKGGITSASGLQAFISGVENKRDLGELDKGHLAQLYASLAPYFNIDKNNKASLKEELKKVKEEDYEKAVAALKENLDKDLDIQAIRDIENPTFADGISVIRADVRNKDHIISDYLEERKDLSEKERSELNVKLNESYDNYSKTLLTKRKSREECLSELLEVLKDFGLDKEDESSYKTFVYRLAGDAYAQSLANVFFGPGGDLEQYIRSYQLFSIAKVGSYESSRFLCGLGKNMSDPDTFPGMIHALTSERIADPIIQLYAGADLSSLTNSYISYSFLSAKIQALPYLELDENDPTRLEFESLKKELDEKAQRVKGAIDSYLSKSDEELGENLRENLSSTLEPVSSWYTRSTDYRAIAQNAVLDAINTLSNMGSSDSAVSKYNSMTENWAFLQTYRDFQKWMCLSSLIQGNDVLNSFSNFDGFIKEIKENTAWSVPDIEKAEGFLNKIKQCKSQTELLKLITKITSDVVKGAKSYDFVTMNFLDVYNIVDNIKECEDVMKNLQLKKYETYISQYNENQKYYRENFKYFTEPSYRGKTVVQILEEKAKKLMESQTSLAVELSLSDVDESERKNCERFARSTVCRQLCEDGLKLIKVSKYEKERSASRQRQSLDILNQRINEIDTSEIELGRSSLSASGAFVFVDYRHIENLMRSNYGYDFARSLNSMIETSLMTRMEAKNIMKAYLQTKAGKNIEEIEDEIARSRTAHDKKNSASDQAMIVRAIQRLDTQSRDSGKEYPWGRMNKALSMLRENNGYDEFVSIEKAIKDKDIDAFRTEVDKALYADPAVSYTLTIDPAMGQKKENAERFARRSQSYLDECKGNSSKEIESLTQKKEKAQKDYDNTSYLADSYLSYSRILGDARNMIWNDEYKDQVKTIINALDKLSALSGVKDFRPIYEEKLNKLEEIINSSRNTWDKAYQNFKALDYARLSDSYLSVSMSNIKAYLDEEKQKGNIALSRPPVVVKEPDDIVIKGSDSSYVYQALLDLIRDESNEVENKKEGKEEKDVLSYLKSRQMPCIRSTQKSTFRYSPQKYEKRLNPDAGTIKSTTRDIESDIQRAFRNSPDERIRKDRMSEQVMRFITSGEYKMHLKV